MVTRTLDPAAADAILESLSGPVLVVDADSRVAYANPAVSMLSGLPVSACLGRSWSQLYPDDDTWVRLEAAARRAATEGTEERHAVTMAAPSGEARLVSWLIRRGPCAPDGRPRTIWIGIDVTDVGRAAEATRRAETLLASVRDNMFDAQLLLSVEPGGTFRIRAANRRYFEVLRQRGYSLDEPTLLGKTRDELLAELGVAAHASEEAHEHYQEAIRTRTAIRFESTLQFHGKLLHIETCIAPIYDDHGVCTHLLRTTRDLTARVAAEQALGETRHAYRQLDVVSRLKDRAIEASVSGIVFTDLDGTIGYVNRSFLRLWGCSHDRHLLGRPLWQSFRDPVAVATVLQRVRFGEDWVGELIARRSDGTRFAVWVSATVIRDEGGDPVQLMASIVDVTARARAEDALRRSEQRYRHLFEQALDGIFLADETARLIDVNACACELTGYTRAELLQMEVRDLTAPHQTLPDLSALPPGSEDIGEFHWVHKDGRPLLVDLRARKLSDGTLLAIVRDVTDRRRAEAEARRMRDLLRTVIDSSPDGIFLKDPQHRFLLVNEAFAAIAGTTPGEMIGRPDSDFWSSAVVEGDASAPGFRPTDRQALAGEVADQGYVPLRHADGSQRIFSTIKRPLTDVDGHVYGVLGYTRDVTEQHAADARRRQSLAEKEILLREIHHRVKNNLQIISSLLHFQAKSVKSPEARVAFEDGRKRLLAMILVHDRLYQSDDLAGVEFGPYARSLVAALVATFEQNGRIRVTMHTDDLRLPAELALPSGLILCELVTNVFKYAYPGEMRGTAVVSATQTGQHVTLAVRDTGIGLPADFDPRAAHTFGWHLVTTLAQQLRATIETATDAGASVRITYPLPTRIEPRWNRSPHLPH